MFAAGICCIVSLSKSVMPLIARVPESVFSAAPGGRHLSDTVLCSFEKFGISRSFACNQNWLDTILQENKDVANFSENSLSDETEVDIFVKELKTEREVFEYRGWTPRHEIVITHMLGTSQREIFRRLAPPYKIKSTDLHPDSFVSKINLTSYRQAFRIYDFERWWMCIKWCLRYVITLREDFFRTWFILALLLSPRMSLSFDISSLWFREKRKW